MIRRSNELQQVRQPEMKGGAGALETTHFLQADEFHGKGRLFAHGRLRPGSSVGLHRHEKDFEVYYILHGHGMYNDDGTIQPVGPGDVTICPEGRSHALDNTGDEDLEYIALILYT